jgi:transcriptional regulator with XRE-family HTH domain
VDHGATGLSGRRARLAATLRGLRYSADLSGEALATQLGWSQSKVSKIENGRTRPSVDDVRSWMRATSASPAVSSELVQLAEEVATDATSWRSVHAAGLTPRQRKIAELEAGASSLQVFQPSVVPGLLQTADYARRVMTLANVAGAHDLSSAVTARLERQAVLFDSTKQFVFVITEAALRWRPGPPAVLLAQLDRLASLASLPNVDLKVVPLDVEAPVLHSNAFVIFEGGEEAFVTAETYTTELVLSDPGDVAIYRGVIDRLASTALEPAEGLRFISDLMARLTRGA